MYSRTKYRVPLLARRIVEAVADAMPDADGAILSAQLDAMNYVQIIDRTIDLYRNRWWGFGRPDWSRVPQFPNQSLEHRLAVVKFRLANRPELESATVYLVRGRLFEVVLSFVPRGLLNTSEVAVVSSAISNSYIVAKTEDVIQKKEMQELPSCLSRVFTGEQMASIKSCYEPQPAAMVREVLNEQFENWPTWLEELLHCTDGFVSDTGVLLGLREIYQVAIGDENFCIIGEFGREGQMGALGFYHGSPEAIHWIDYSGMGHLELGSNHIESVPIAVVTLLTFMPLASRSFS